MAFVNANLQIQSFINNYGNQARTYGVLKYVPAVSDANTSVELVPNSFLFGPGKLRSVRLNYFPIQCDVEGSCDANICDTGEVVEPKQINFDIARCTATKVYSVRKDDIRLIDNNQWTFSGTARQIIASIMPAARRMLAIDWVTLLYDMAGVHPDGNETHRITVTNPTNGIVNPLGRFDIEREYMDAGYTEPYILGGAEAYNWQKMVDIGGLNAQGQYINQLDTGRVWYDDGLGDTILNDLETGGHMLAIAPEVFKYVWYTENAGLFQTGTASIDDLDAIYRNGSERLLEGTLIDPVTGIVWDLYIHYELCDQIWKIQLKHRWDFFLMPDTTCVAEGVNGIMHYRTCPPKLAECPTGDNPPSPVTASTFSWTPTLADLPTISQSVIGGYASTQNEPVLIANITALKNYMNQNSQMTFTVNGSDIEYTGFNAISASFNGGDVTATFS